MKVIFYNCVPILLVLLTGYMIYADKKNWGWVLFAALIITVVPTGSDDKKNSQ